MYLRSLIVPPGHKLDERLVGRLVESIRRVGQLEPVVVRVPTNNDRARLGLKPRGYERILVSGFHRAEAVRRLSVGDANAELLALETFDSERDDGVTEEEVRIDENVVRAHLTRDELAQLTKQRQALTGARLGSGGKRNGSGAKKTEAAPGSQKAKRQERPTVQQNQSDKMSQDGPMAEPKKQDLPKVEYPKSRPPAPAVKEVAVLAGVSPRTVQRAVAAWDGRMPVVKPQPVSREAQNPRILHHLKRWWLRASTTEQREFLRWIKS